MTVPHGQNGDGPRVTIVVVPRERFSIALRSLESIYAHTEEPFDLVYVDGASPPPVRDALRAESVRRGFTLVRTEKYLWPNRARNIGLASVRTPYVAFVDNDVLVTPGWLTALVDAAEATGAWVVGPMAFEGDPAEGVVHNAGGFWRFEGPPGRRDLVQDNRYGHRHLSELPADFGRQRVDYVEFHCVLVRTAAFDTVGPLDEKLFSTREHLDLCLQVTEAGGEVWSETAARVTYDNPPPVRRSDAAFFSLRWSEAWNKASVRHFATKHGLDPAYHRRAAKSGARRQALFHPVRVVVGRRLGDRAERVVVAALTRLERLVNIVVVGRLVRPVATKTST